MGALVLSYIVLTQARAGALGHVRQNRQSAAQEVACEGVLRDLAETDSLRSASPGKGPMIDRRIAVGVTFVAIRTSHEDLREAGTRMEQSSKSSIYCQWIARILFSVEFNDPKPGSPFAFATVDVKHGRITWPPTPSIRGNRLAPMYKQWDTYRKRLGFRPKEQLKELSHRMAVAR